MAIHTGWTFGHIRMLPYRDYTLLGKLLIVYEQALAAGRDNQQAGEVIRRTVL